MKKLLGVKRTTQNYFIYGELGRVNLQTHRYYSIIKYWTQLLTTDINKYSKKIYLLLKIDCENIGVRYLNNYYVHLGFTKYGCSRKFFILYFYLMLNKGYLISVFKVGMGD